MSVFLGGKLFADDGAMTCLDGAAGVSGTAVYVGRLACEQTGEPFVEDLTTNAVPAGAILADFAYHADGRLYVTSDTVHASDVYNGGLRFRADGALRVSTAAVDPSDSKIGGWSVASTGEARVTIT
jgi:hypothetical protein